MESMSWLEDLHAERIFHYDSGEDRITGNIQDLSLLAKKDVVGVPGEMIYVDDKTYEYAGFDSIKAAQMSKVEFEKNGRKAYRITDSSGKIRYIAKSKHEYLKHGEIEGKKLQRRGKVTPLKAGENT
jgi:hypothetical protein